MALPAFTTGIPGQDAAMQAALFAANVSGFASAGTSLFSAAQSVVANQVAQTGQAVQTVAFITQTALGATGQQLTALKQGESSIGHGIVERSVG